MTPHKHPRERKMVIKIKEKSIGKIKTRERMEMDSPLMQ